MFAIYQQKRLKRTRGDLKTPGENSPYRNRSIEENMRLFENMKQGHYQDGERV
jgi:glutaminyl-tRNA synthetase